jgi:hypothetical protein
MKSYYIACVKVAVRLENKVIVSESRRDESNYEPFDALASFACSG